MLSLITELSRGCLNFVPNRTYKSHLTICGTWRECLNLHGLYVNGLIAINWFQDSEVVLIFGCSLALGIFPRNQVQVRSLG